MENKYYIPGIEEFNVGFEYEYQEYNDDLDECVDFWIKRFLYHLEDFTGEMEDALTDGRVRVKYLNQEDIESIGFKLDPIRSYFNYRNSFSLINEPYKLSLDHIYNENKIILRGHKVDYPTKTLFEGTIKNLSEFKKLLKQTKYE